MKPAIRPLPTTAAIIMLVLASGCVTPDQTRSTADARGLFLNEVKPILERNCLRCHDGSSPIALNLRNRDLALASKHADGQVFIVPGRPDQSLLVTAVSRSGSHPKMMPRQPVSLTDMELGALREWISAGAVWPTGLEGELRPKPNPENP